MDHSYSDAVEVYTWPSYPRSNTARGKGYGSIYVSGKGNDYAQAAFYLATWTAVPMPRAKAQSDVSKKEVFRNVKRQTNRWSKKRRGKKL